MIKRFAVLLAIIASALLAGCAGTRYNLGGVHAGNHNVVAGSVAGVVGGMQPVGYMLPQPVASGGACRYGTYRYEGGAWVRQCGYAGQNLAPQSFYHEGLVYCTVKSRTGDSVVEKTIRTGSDSECHELGNLVREVKSQAANVRTNDELVSSRKQAYRRSDGTCFFSDNGPATLPSQCREKKSLPGLTGEYRSQWVTRADAQ